MATRNLEYVISARDRFTGTANRIMGTLGRMERSAGRIGRGFGQLSSGLTRFGLVAGTAVVGGLAAAAKAAGDFEAQLNTINTIAHVSDLELTKMGEGIRSLAREGRGDLADLTAAYYDLLSAGIKAADAQGVLDAATKLAIGGLSTNAEAVDILTSAINAYGQSASAAGADADLFAKAIELGKVKADEIAASFSNVAPVAAQAGIELQEITAAYAALTAQGTPASEVATQMQRAIVEILKPSATLVKLQKKLNVNFAEMAREKGLVVALQAMRDAAEDAGIPFIELFGRVEAYKFGLQTTGPQQGVYNRALDAMGDSAGTAAAQMAERQQGLNYEVKRLKNNILDAAISLGEGFTPALGRLAEKLTAFVEKHTSDFVRFGKNLGTALDRIDFDRILDALDELAASFKRDVLPVLQGALTAFSALPGPVKSLAAALAALSVTPGVKDILGGLGNIGASLAGLATAPLRGIVTRIPGIGQFAAQPVYVTNWKMIAAGGGLGGAMGIGGKGLPWPVKVIGAVFIGFTLAELALAISGINDPSHQFDVPNRFGGRTFRGTNDQLTQLENVNKNILMLEERTDDFGKRQLAEQIEIRKRLEREIAGIEEGTEATRSGFLGLRTAIRDAIAKLPGALSKASGKAGRIAEHERTGGIPLLKKVRFGTAETPGILDAAAMRVSHLLSAVGKGPAYRPTIENDIAAMRRIQEEFLAKGDRQSAETLGAYIEALERVLGPLVAKLTPEKPAGAAAGGMGKQPPGPWDVVNALRGIQETITTNVIVNITPRQITTAVTTQSRYGPSTGSAGGRWGGI